MGGIGRYAWCLLREFSRLDEVNEYVCYFTHLDLPEPLDLPSRFRIRRFRAGMVDDRFDQMMLPSLLNEDRIDVYHNPTFAVPLVRTRARTVATIHDVVFRRHPNLVEHHLKSYLDLATLRSCKAADHLITVSHFSKREILSLYPAEDHKLSVIHNGVELRTGEDVSDRESFRPLTERVGLRYGMYVLYVGSIETKKNIGVLLQAFSRISRTEEGQSLKLAIAGARNDAAYPLESSIRELGIEQRVKVLGYVSSNLLEALYAGALVFVYPSLYEGFGFPPLEAMVRGVPTIVSDASSLPEVVGDAALLFDPNRPEQLADVLTSFITDSQRRQEYSKRGVRQAARFTWRRCAEEHLRVYEQLSRIHEAAPLGV